jgi:hypothetical protein
VKSVSGRVVGGEWDAVCILNAGGLAELPWAKAMPGATAHNAAITTTNLNMVPILFPDTKTDLVTIRVLCGDCCNPNSVVVLHRDI